MKELTTLTALLTAALLPLLLMQSAHTNIQSIASGAAPINDAQTLSDHAHAELLMGYDILTNVFSGQSKLWLVPIFRKLSRGAPLLDETQEIILKLSEVSSKRIHELRKQRLRHLHPSVSKKFIDPNEPNKLVDSIAQNIVWGLLQDLSVRGDEFDLNFGIEYKWHHHE